MEIVTDLVKKMSISGDTGTLVANKASDQFSTVESSRQLDDEAFVKSRSSFMRTQSEVDLNLNDKMYWPMREGIGKRRKKHTLHWLEYQSSQLEEKRSRLYSRLIRKSNAVNDLLYSPRNVEVVREQMLQVADLFKMVTEVHKEYNALLPVEQQDKDEEWFYEIDASMLQFKLKIHGWIRDVERERDAAMKSKPKRSSVSGSVSSKRSSRRWSTSSSGSRSSESDKALKEKLRMAEMLTEVRFPEVRQTAEFKAQKLKVEEQYAKSRARVKVSEDLEGDNVNLAISHNAKIDIACNPVNNRNIESGMMPTRKDIMPKKFEAHQNVEAHQAPAMFFYDIKIGDECSNIKAMLPSREPTDMLCKFLKVQSAPDVDMECFDGNVLEYHYFMALFREVIKSKIEDPRGRLTELPEFLSNTVSNFPSMKALLRQSTF